MIISLWYILAEEPKPKECELACSDGQHVTCLACLNDVTPHEYCEKYQRTKGCKGMISEYFKGYEF